MIQRLTIPRNLPVILLIRSVVAGSAASAGEDGFLSFLPFLLIRKNRILSSQKFNNRTKERIRRERDSS